MLSFRVIARLDIKGSNLIKGIRMEGLRVIGKPADFARKYAESGADELLYIDTVASLYGRNQLEGLISETTDHTFIPITVGGGIATVEDARRLFNAGADKIAINTAAIRNPSIVHEISDRYGCQAVTVSIQAKKTPTGWECYTDCGREKTGKCVQRWAEEAVRLGAGEILLTSVDRDGTRKGADIDLAGRLDLGVPVVLCGGIGTPEHAQAAAEVADAIAIGCALHYGHTSIANIKVALSLSGMEVRV